MVMWDQFNVFSKLGKIIELKPDAHKKRDHILSKRVYVLDNPT